MIVELQKDAPCPQCKGPLSEGLYDKGRVLRCIACGIIFPSIEQLEAEYALTPEEKAILDSVPDYDPEKDHDR